MQSQKQEAQRTLSQAKTEADECIFDLEYQLKFTKATLDDEQNSFASTKEDLLKEIDDLRLENSELKAEFNKVIIVLCILRADCLNFQLSVTHMANCSRRVIPDVLLM